MQCSWSMNISHDQLRQWYLERLVGVLSKGDERQLIRLLKTNPMFRSVWKSLEKECVEIHGNDFQRHLNPECALRQTKARMRSKS